jgi:hypothetical protein
MPERTTMMLTNDLNDFIWAAKNLSETHKVTTESLIKILEVTLNASK